MTFDQQLQHTLETFSERLRGETARALATLTDELASAVAAERASAAALLTAETRLAAEQEAGVRLAAALAAAEQEAGARVADALAAADQQARARSAETLEAAERDARVAMADALAAAEREAGARMAEALAAAEQQAAARLADALAAAEHQAGVRMADALAAAEREVGVRISDALAGADRESGARLAEALGTAEQKTVIRVADAVAAAEREAATQLAAAVAAAEAKGREAGLQTGRDEGREEGRQQGREQGRQEAREEGASADLRSTELAANERLVDAVRALDRARSLSEILDTLASCAGREAKRVGVLLVRHGQLRGWRFIGFGPGLDERTDYELRSGDAGVIADAARTGLTASADSATPLSTPAFAELPPGREVLALPVPMSGQVVAVLYADQGPAEITDAALRVAWPAMLEVMARHAARCLEAITALRAAQVLTGRPDAISHPVVDSPSGPVKIAAAGEKEDDDQAATRYARLLVSEIKLYHEAAVIAGRRERDLMTRLGGEIARARALYEQRVPADARRGPDHFHDELVRTLANGDAGLLEARS